jgi:hypothetical protein
MLSLNSTLRSLTVALSGSVTTNQLDCTAQYRDDRVNSITMSFGTTVTATNNTTAVTLVAAPTSGVIREVFTLTIYNKDTAAAIVSVSYLDNATSYTIARFTLAVGDVMVYTDEHGWVVFNSVGDRKTS